MPAQGHKSRLGRTTDTQNRPPCRKPRAWADLCRSWVVRVTVRSRRIGASMTDSETDIALAVLPVLAVRRTRRASCPIDQVSPFAAADQVSRSGAVSADLGGERRPDQLTAQDQSVTVTSRVDSITIPFPPQAGHASACCPVELGAAVEAPQPVQRPPPVHRRALHTGAHRRQPPRRVCRCEVDAGVDSQGDGADALSVGRLGQRGDSRAHQSRFVHGR